jgi:hypothetical protein
MQFKINWNFYIFSSVLLAGFMLTSCKSSKEEQSYDPSAKATYETDEFLEFYDRFAKDSLFQLEHIVFPLEGIKAPKDSTDVIRPDFKWQKENWIIHKPFDDMGGTFSRELMDINGIVIELISDNTGQFTMERRFGNLSSGWHLIYYREMGRY